MAYDFTQVPVDDTKNTPYQFTQTPVGANTSIPYEFTQTPVVSAPIVPINVSISTPEQIGKSISFNDGNKNNFGVDTTNPNLQLLNQANLNQSTNLVSKISSNQYLNSTANSLLDNKIDFKFDLSKQIDGIKNAKSSELSDFQKTQLITNYNQVQNDIQNNLDKLQTNNTSFINSIKRNSDDALFLGRLQSQNFGADIDLSTRNLSNVADSIKQGEKSLVETQQKFNQSIKDIYIAGQQSASQLANQAVQYENSNKTFEEQKYQNAIANQKYIDGVLTQSFGKLYVSEVSRAKDGTGNYIVNPIAKGNNYTMSGASDLLTLKDRKFKYDEYTDPANVAFRDTANQLNIEQASSSLKTQELNNRLNIEAANAKMEEQKKENQIQQSNNTSQPTSNNSGVVSFDDYLRNQNVINEYIKGDQSYRTNNKSSYDEAIKQNGGNLSKYGTLSYAGDIKVETETDPKTKVTKRKLNELTINPDTFNLFGIFSGKTGDLFTEQNQNELKKYFEGQGITVKEGLIEKYFKSGQDAIKKAISDPESDGNYISKFVLRSEDGKSIAILPRNISDQNDKSYKGFVIDGNKLSKELVDKFISEVNDIKIQNNNIEPIINLMDKPEYISIKNARSASDGGNTALNSSLSTIIEKAQLLNISFDRKIIDGVSMRSMIASANMFTGIRPQTVDLLKSPVGLDKQSKNLDAYFKINESVSKYVLDLKNIITGYSDAIGVKIENTGHDLKTHLDFYKAKGNGDLRAGLKPARGDTSKTADLNRFILAQLGDLSEVNNISNNNNTYVKKIDDKNVVQITPISNIPTKDQNGNDISIKESKITDMFNTINNIENTDEKNKTRATVYNSLNISFADQFDKQLLNGLLYK